MDYKDEDLLMLSGIQHYVFCRRQWALIHIEKQWAENVRTVEGQILHQRAHDNSIVEKRGDMIISRAMPVVSRRMGISGECDVVEFHRSPEGINLTGREGKFSVTPVEYKKGRPKEDLCDILQLTAQAMCLEEMLCCQIDKGYLFYGETRHRQKVEITEDLRIQVREIFQDMHKLYQLGYTPKTKRTKACNACSLRDICLPVLMKNKSAKAYVERTIAESTGSDTYVVVNEDGSQ